jgi:hypothetical protein
MSKTILRHTLIKNGASSSSEKQATGPGL